MDKPIRIGTRESPLAVWQAERVATLLEANGQPTEIVFIKSEGDQDLVTPLYELGIQGIFTKTLDIALLDNRIDIAVHSFKDVPTILAGGLQVAAVIERDNPADILICKDEAFAADLQMAIDNTEAHALFMQRYPSLSIATSSIRRKAQWLHRFPQTTIEAIRGNVNTRIDKVKASEWQGAVFAAAGIERLGLTEKETGPQVTLSFMHPAPAQGAIVVVARKNDDAVINTCAAMNDEHTAICTKIERDLLSILLGGCSTPISAFAKVEYDRVFLTANITSPGGGESITVSMDAPVSDHSSIAAKTAAALKEKGGLNLLKK